MQAVVEVNNSFIWSVLNLFKDEDRPVLSVLNVVIRLSIVRLVHVFPARIREKVYGLREQNVFLIRHV